MDDSTTTTAGDIAWIRANMATKTDITSVNEKMATKQDIALMATKGDITSMQGDVASMQGDITSMQGDVASMRGEMVSKTDFVSLKKELTISFQNVEASIHKMHVDLVRADDEILSVLVSVDQRLTAKTNDHERRIKRLERQAA